MNAMAARTLPTVIKTRGSTNQMGRGEASECVKYVDS